jgi:DNA-binding IclR family transcriptional regulator
MPQTMSGAQTVDRTCTLLKEIGRHAAAGVRLVDLTDTLGLSRPTIHRILRSLAAFDFVRQDALTKRYRLGGTIYGLGLAAPGPLERLPEMRPLLDALAARTGDTAYLMLRKGDEVMCIARAEGASPIRTYVIEVGAIRPIGATIAGITMLATLPDDDVDAILKRTTAAMRLFRNATPDYVRQQIERVRRNGFCISERVYIEGATGLSAPVRCGEGPPQLAVSMSAISSRVPESRVRPLADELMRTCAQMAARLSRP